MEPDSNMSEAAMHAAPERRPSVLLVDDERKLVELLGAVLEAQGFDTTIATNLADATKLLQALHYDAVVTDVLFDGREDGLEVLGATRELQPHACVLMMTGRAEIPAAVAAIKKGAADYLQKPVDPVHLAATLSRVMEEQKIGEATLGFADLAGILTSMVAHTIERVDPYTAGHGARTRKYCRMLAQKMGVEDRSRERLELAGIAHDYGKIYLDDLTFLTKNGPLTPAEYEEVKKHPLLGARKLGTHPMLKEVCQYVAEHHERWDGTGYPKKIKGEEISLPGRILCVVEVFDSLATKRSYKEGWELPKVLDFFAEQRAKMFDPDVLDQFLILLGEHGDAWLKAPAAARAEAAAKKAAEQA
jgi:putative two-component system response regulator